MTLETVKAIAMLCQVIAGDNPSLNTMDAMIQSRQVHCHAYYADCLSKNKIDFCMSNREKKLKDEYMEMLRMTNER